MKNFGKVVLNMYLADFGPIRRIFVSYIMADKVCVTHQYTAIKIEGCPRYYMNDNAMFCI